MGLFDNLYGGGQQYGDLVGDSAREEAKRRALLAISSQLLQAGGPQRLPVSAGQAIGGALQAGQGASDEAYQSAIQAALMKQKMNPGAQAPKTYVVGRDLVDETGKVLYSSPQAQGVQTETADIMNHKFFLGLPEEQQKIWRENQRQPTAPQLTTINGVPTLVDRIRGSTTPLSNIQTEAAAAGTLAEGKAVGAATGEARGAMAKKGINALNVLETLDLADPLIDVATGSGAGAARDKVAAFFGESTTGDQAIAQLKIVQANLMTNMPRMEGPQSDRDVQLYREAAGELGDAAVPRERKKAALSMIRSLQLKYAEGVKSDAAPKKRKYNPQTGKIE